MNPRSQAPDLRPEPFSRLARSTCCQRPKPWQPCDPNARLSRLFSRNPQRPKSLRSPRNRHCAGISHTLPQTFQTYRELLLLVNAPALLFWFWEPIWRSRGHARDRRGMQARSKARLRKTFKRSWEVLANLAITAKTLRASLASWEAAARI